MVNFYSIQRSAEIAKEKGETFDQYEGSTYATGEYFDKYVSTDFSPKYEKSLICLKVCISRRQRTGKAKSICR